MTPHSVVNARHSCHSSLYALRQATGLSGIPLLSVCPRTALSLCIGSVCVSEAKEFAEHTRKDPKENANEWWRRRGPLFDRISAHKRITLIGGTKKREYEKKIKMKEVGRDLIVNAKQSVVFPGQKSDKASQHLRT